MDKYKFLRLELPTISCLPPENGDFSCTSRIMESISSQYPEYIFTQIVYFPEQRKEYTSNYNSTTCMYENKELIFMVQQPYALLRLNKVGELLNE